MVADRKSKKYKRAGTIISLGQTQNFAPVTPQGDGIVVGNIENVNSQPLGETPIIPQEQSFKLMNFNETIDRVEDMGSLTESSLERAKYYFSQQDWERTIAACQDALSIPSEQAEAYRIWGNALQKQGKISEAMGYYAKVLEIQPRTPEIYVNLGSIYAQKKQWQKAIRYFEQAIELKPDFDGAYRNLARVWTELGDIDKATEANYRAYQIAPQKVTAADHYLLGRQLLSQQRLDEAIECYRQAIDKRQDWLEVYEHLANLLEKLGQWEEAVTYRRQIIILQRKQGQTPTTPLLPKAIFPNKTTSKSPNKPQNSEIVQFYLEQIEQDPKSAENHTILGSLFEQKQQWKQAVASYRNSLQIDPQQPQLYYKIAQILLKVGREDVAADCWYHFLSFSDTNVDPKELLQLGNLYQKLNKIDSAYSCYHRAFKLQPQLVEAYDRLVEIYLQQGKMETAIEVYKTALKYNPQEHRIYYNLGKLFAAGKNWSTAVTCYQKATSLDSDSWQVRHELGDAFSQQKFWQEAANAYRKSIELKPDFFWSYNNLGYALLHLDAPEEAIQVLQSALKLKQDFHWTYHNLGAAYLSLGCWEEAATAYNRVLQLQPQSDEAAERLDYALQQKAAADSNLAFELYLEAIAQNPDDIESYQQALEIHNDRPELYLGLAEAYGRKQEWEKALVNYRQAEALSPDNEAINTQINAIQLRIDSSALSPDFRGEDSGIVVAATVEISAVLGVLATTAKAICLAENLWLCLHPLADGMEALKPFRSVEIVDREGNNYLLVIAEDSDLEIATDIGETLAPFLPQSSREIFKLLEIIYADYPEITNSNAIVRLYRQISQDLISSQLRIDRGYWLAPSLFYLEASVESTWLGGEVEIFAFGEDNWAVGKARAFQISERELSIVATFDREIYHSPHAAYSLAVDTGAKILKIEGEIFAKAYSLEFIETFNQKPEYQKHLIRETIAKTILDRGMDEDSAIDNSCREDRANIVQKLQYFSKINPIYPNNPDIPFQVFFDWVIPIKTDGLFISGWLQDPYELLESIEAISDLGISLSISKENIHKFDRQDVSEHLKNTPYGHFEGKHGFCAYFSLPEDIRQQLQGFAELHSFRFRLHLKGRIYIEYVPAIQHQDIHSARQTILHIAPPAKIDEAMLTECIAPAASKLHQYCIETAAIKEVKTFGKPIAEPSISIIIPLYKCLDFLKVQFATMANDSSLRDNCELIYVLDSPEQEKEVKDFLQHHCLLYRLPVTLVVVARNSGYAAANNLGATQARGKYLILMNSDVFPKQGGWTQKMAEFYATNPQIGTIAPKLLYEDDSLQHAGMYFSKTTFPFWLTLHYYKGFPHSYPPARISRQVPAVTGACLFVAKELFDRVGGITTDYIIGDFEDSDFCFKCASLGYESWYFADAELYHLERQSVPLNNIYAHSLAWQYNARLHDDRWESVISHQSSVIN
jgi:tetratricopeptide (TPR) repeat protein/GT2 family glycosyltransferase